MHEQNNPVLKLDIALNIPDWWCCHMIVFWGWWAEECWIMHVVLKCHTGKYGINNGNASGNKLKILDVQAQTRKTQIKR